MDHAADGLRENYNKELGFKENLSSQLSKALGEVITGRQKYKIDGVAKAKELEMVK